MDLEGFIFDSRQASSKRELFSLYEKIMDEYGFDQLAYAMTSDHPELQSGHDITVIKRSAMHGWDEYYLENNYSDYDYIHAHAKQNAGVFEWNKIVRENDLSTTQHRIFNEAREATLFNGHSISMHGAAKAVTVASTSNKAQTFRPHTHDLINVASFQFHQCYLTLSGLGLKKKTPALSNREQEILKWFSKGLTKNEISDRMNISVHTVDYHMRNILIKTDAKNSTNALIIAINQGSVVI